MSLRHNPVRYLEIEPGNLASLQASLSQFRTLLDNHQAFDSYYLAVQERQDRDDWGQALPLLACFDEWEIHYSFDMLLFAAALAHPELNDEVAATARAMVAYCRRVNDSAYLFADEDGEQQFAVFALYLLARQLPQYSYLLGHALVPYWDTNLDYPSCMLLYRLVQERGWTQDLIKAYLWCDNDRFRRAMYDGGEEHPTSLPSLASHLTHHPEALAAFQNSLVRRLRAVPLLAFSDREEYTDFPSLLMAFFYDLDSWGEQGCPYYDDDDLVARLDSQLLCGQSLAQHGSALLQRLRQEGQGPWVIISDSDRLDWHSQLAEEEDQAAAPGRSWDYLRAFFASLPRGQALIDYVVRGGDNRFLGQYPPFDFRKLKRAQAPDLYEHLLFWVANDSPQELSCDIMAGNIGLVLMGAERLLATAKDQDIYWRLLDVFDALLAHPQWPASFYQDLAKQYDIDLSLSQSRHRSLPAQDKLAQALLAAREELNLKAMQAIEAKLGGPLPAPDLWPDSPKARAFAAYHLAKHQGEAALVAYLGQQLVKDWWATLSSAALPKPCCQALERYLQSGEAVEETAAALGQALAKEAPYSPSQPAYEWLEQDDLEPVLASLFWQLLAATPAAEAKRLFALLLALAPVFTLSRFVRQTQKTNPNGWFADASQAPDWYQPQDDFSPSQDEEACYAFLAQLSVPAHLLELLATFGHYQQALHPRNHEPCYWQKVLGRLDYYGQHPAAAEAWLGHLALAGEEVQAWFQMALHLRCGQPFPWSLFWTQLRRFVDFNLLPGLGGETLFGQLQGYLQGQLPLADALAAIKDQCLMEELALGRYNPHQVQLSDMLWLLPKDTGDRLAQLFLGLGVEGFCLFDSDWRSLLWLQLGCLDWRHYPSNKRYGRWEDNRIELDRYALEQLERQGAAPQQLLELALFQFDEFVCRSVLRRLDPKAEAGWFTAMNSVSKQNLLKLIAKEPQGLKMLALLRQDSDLRIREKALPLTVKYRHLLK